MSLPWFSFNIKDFVANTMRLNTEAKGAYLMLLLDYYEHETPPPDDDNVLAAITGLSPDQWRKHRPIIETLFVSINGRWTHSRVEEEIKVSHTKHNKKVAQTKAAVAARIAKQANQLGGKQKEPSKAANIERPIIPTSHVLVNVPIIETSDVPIDVTSTQTQTQTQIEVSPSYEGDSAREGLDGFGSTISPDWALTGTQTKLLLSDGYRADQIIAEVGRFKRAKINDGSISIDWDVSWRNWWDRHKPPLHPNERPKKAPPRVEVTRTGNIKTPIPPDWQPNARHAELAAQHNYDLADIEESFRDSCKSKGYVYHDHDAAFRNYIKNQKNFTRGSSNAKAPSRGGSLVDAGLESSASLQRQIEEAESRERRSGAAVPVLSQDGLREPEGGFGVDGDGADGVFASDRE